MEENAGFVGRLRTRRHDAPSCLFSRPAWRRVERYQFPPRRGRHTRQRRSGGLDEITHLAKSKQWLMYLRLKLHLPAVCHLEAL